MKKKHADMAEGRLAELTPRLMNESEAAIYLGLSVARLRVLRADTPLRFTKETFQAALDSGETVPIPFLKIGGSVRYDVKKLDMWIDRQRVIGDLPTEAAS